MFNLKSWNYKKIANLLIYFVAAYFILTQKDTGSKYFNTIRIVEFCTVLAIYYYVRAKISKNTI